MGRDTFLVGIEESLQTNSFVPITGIFTSVSEWDAILEGVDSASQPGCGT